MTSRPIKFRAWDKTNKRWLNRIAVHLDGWIQDFEIDDGRDDVDLQQFTGLLDKNGKEIYEGDILATSNDGTDGADEWKQEVIGAVFWDDASAMFWGTPDNDPESMYHARYVAVVGNIYENPELLTGTCVVCGHEINESVGCCQQQKWDGNELSDCCDKCVTRPAA